MHGHRRLAFVSQVPGQLLQINLVQLETAYSSDLFVSVLESFKLDRWDFTWVEGTGWLLNQSEG